MAAAEGELSAARAMALTPLSTEGGGSARWRCPPVRFLAGAAAAVLEESLAVSLPLPPCFGARGGRAAAETAEGFGRARFAGGGLWNRSGIFALRFARPPSGAIAGAGGGVVRVAAGAILLSPIRYRTNRTRAGGRARGSVAGG